VDCCCVDFVVVVWARVKVELPSKHAASRKAPAEREKLFISKKPPKIRNDLRVGSI
jgi:hypothetical protein